MFHFFSRAILLLAFSLLPPISSALASEPWVEEIREKAVQGDPFAQTTLGACYELGEGVSQDRKTAVEWYAKAARQKWAGGLVRLGRCYARGEGVPKKPSKAVELWSEAAAMPFMAGTSYRPQEAHIMEARAELAHALRTGEGISRDVAKAIQTALPAAEWGLPAAEYELGLCYLEEEHKDVSKAEAWLKRSLKGGIQEAAAVMEHMHL
ncbi:MAG: tetratricopeptide repeat protein [Mailhella sp.]